MDDDEGGLSIEEGIETARMMEAAGIDAIEVSGGVGNAFRPLEQGEIEFPCYLDRAIVLKKRINLSVITVGGLRSFETINALITNRDVDMVSMCRSFIREPQLAKRWRAGDTRPATCITCGKCMAIAIRDHSLECGEDRRLREQALEGRQ